MNDPKSDHSRKKDFQLSEDHEGTDANGDAAAAALLTNIKGFQIEKSKYQHYGHKSSMTAQALNKIIEDEKTEKTASSSTVVAEKKNKSIIDNSLGDLLDLPHGGEDFVWPYSSETLSDLIKLKTEQERTKQEAIKNEFVSNAVKVLSLVKSMNISHDLIPQFFQNSLTDMRKQMESMPHTQQFRGEEGRKRSYSDTAKDELHPQEATLVSPIRSPTKSPDSMHRRERSDENLSNAHSPSSNNASYTEVHSQQQSPSQIPQHPLPPHMYPIYYHGPPPPHPPPAQGTSEGSKSLGSPYQQKYQPMMYPVPNPSQPPYAGPGPAGPGPYYSQQYHYYAASAKPQQPPYASMVPPMAPPPPAFAAYEEDSPSHKKQKSANTSTSTSTKANINFMISTPKNPPARKYNHPKEK